MAKHIARFLPERRLLEQTLTTDNLEKAAPRLHTFHEGIKEYESLQNEISTLGKYTGRSGFSADGHFQRIASIPLSVKAAVQELIPDAFEDKDTLYGLLAGPLAQYDVRNKVIL